MSATDLVDGWAVVGPSGVQAHGITDAVVPWASVTKVLFSLATWVAVEEGTLDLDAPAGPPGSTLRHLLAHASGLAFEGDAVLAAPGTRRIYSNTGIEVAAGVLETGAGMPWSDYVVEAVDGGVRVAVMDGGTGPVDGITGEGLTLVASVARRWGTSMPQSGGKAVWFELEG